MQYERTISYKGMETTSKKSDVDPIIGPKLPETQL